MSFRTAPPTQLYELSATARARNSARMMSRLALAIALTLAVTARARAQDPDCKSAENYSACMNAKGQKEIGGAKTGTPATESLEERRRKTREAEEARKSDSVARVRSDIAQRAKAEGIVGST